jgi:hypothetical protein
MSIGSVDENHGEEITMLYSRIGKSFRNELKETLLVEDII